MGFDCDNAVFRFCKSLKNKPGIRGLSEIVMAIMVSIRNLGHVVILSTFSLFTTSVIGLQIYMGVLTQKCILPFKSIPGTPEDDALKLLQAHNQDPSNWMIDSDPDNPQEYKLCGYYGFGRCPDNYTCVQGFGGNPDYDYTSFDSIWWSLLSIFRLMTLDYWERLYQHILTSAGTWHIWFFIVFIFFFSFYLVNLILAVVVTSYEKIAKKWDTDSGMKSDLEIQNQNALDNGSEGTSFCNRFCAWDFGRIQKYIRSIVLHPFAELFFAFTVVANIIFLASDHYGVQENHVLHRSLTNGLKVFSCIYAIEVVLGILALSPKHYFAKGSNILNFAIATCSIIGLVFEDANLPGKSSLGATPILLVYIRLFRIFKLYPGTGTFNLLVRIICNSIQRLTAVWIVISIICTSFAFLGQVLFSSNYIEKISSFPFSILPRWNFTDFWHSLMVVIRSLCGEWIESMWDCMLVGGQASCVTFFIVLVIFGYFVLMNLFVAVVFYTFKTEILSPPPLCLADDVLRLVEAFSRIGRMLDWFKKLFSVSKRDTSHVLLVNMPDSIRRREDEPVLEEMEQIEISEAIPDSSANDDQPQSDKGVTSALKGKTASPKMLKLLQIIEHESAFVVLILVYCFCLALQDIHFYKNADLYSVLTFLKGVINLIFFVEMMVKWSALGVKIYLADGWNRLYCFIVLVTVLHFVLGTFGMGGIPLHTFITSLWAIRLLKTLSKTTGMKLILNTITASVTSILNVILVCLFVWLIFAIFGVQFFNGKFHKCLDSEGNRPDHQVIEDKLTCYTHNMTWDNAEMNFDNLGNAYLSLLQVATFKGWIPIMQDAVDTREIDQQPALEVNYIMKIYFVIFLIFGSFLIRSLFISVLAYKFKQEDEKMNQTFGMTLYEKKYYMAMKRSREREPRTVVPAEPNNAAQLLIFKLVTHPVFEVVIVVVIFLNVVVLSLDHYGQSRDWDNVLDLLNAIFILIYVIEATLKIFGLGRAYFHDCLNVFDFVVVILCLLGMLLSDLVEKYFISPTLLRFGRLLRIGRVLRGWLATKGIRTLLRTLTSSLPALLSISVLLLLVMFLYSTLGMSTILHVRFRGGLNTLVNFQTVANSFILLFQISTMAGWDGILTALIEQDDCNVSWEHGKPADCGNRTFGMVFMISYLVITYFVIWNTAVGVILGKYGQVIEDEENDVALTEDEYEMFDENWTRFFKDTNSPEYIRYDQLSEFLHSLKPPLQIAKPNILKIKDMDIPICKGDVVSKLDILDALSRERIQFDGMDYSKVAQKIWGKDELVNERVATTKNVQLPDENSVIV